MHFYIQFLCSYDGCKIFNDMTYLKEFKKKIKKNDYHEFLKLWEEYCHLEKVSSEELFQILKETKDSPLVDSFGKHVDRAISLWSQIEDKEKKYNILKIIIDIQNANTEALAEIAFQALKERYKEDKDFNEKIRLIGLRSRKNFQKALTNYEFLSHLAKGKFVFHTGGWGTGEILDISSIREEMVLEFEYVIGPKYFTFEKALNTLISLPDDHFLSLRFGKPEFLEKKAKEDPLFLITLLLKDLGPKTIIEIKEEICDLIIPEKDWAKWWQSAKFKMKKSTKIEKIKNLNKHFRLRKEELPHEESLYLSLENKPDTNKTIHLVYSFLKDFPEMLKKRPFIEKLDFKIKELFSCEEITDSQKIQLLFLLNMLETEKNSIELIGEIIKQKNFFSDLLSEIEIISFKKKFLSLIKANKEKWDDIFLNQFFYVKQNVLRDYILTELEKEEKREKINEKIEEMILYPAKYPEVFVWYFQRSLKKEEKNIVKLFESFLILLDYLYQKPKYKDLIKKMINIIKKNKYQVIREIMKKTSLEEVKELLLLATKCNVLSDHEIKIINSLAASIYPELKKEKKKETDTLWATKEGFEKIKKRLNEIISVDIIDNAKEIKEARALGDLRENAEFKAALERRNRLQLDIKVLTDQINKIRILNKKDINTNQVSIGTVIECEEDGKIVRFTILGPLEADAEKNIFSFDSKIAKSMIGLKVGEFFQFKDRKFKIKKISNFLE